MNGLSSGASACVTLFLTSLSSGTDLFRVHSWLLAICTRETQTEKNSQRTWSTQRFIIASFSVTRSKKGSGHNGRHYVAAVNPQLLQHWSSWAPVWPWEVILMKITFQSQRGSEKVHAAPHMLLWAEPEELQIKIKPTTNPQINKTQKITIKL